jgi:hypothetical protein
MGMAGIMGRMNDFNQFMGKVQGTMDAMAPALASVQYGMTNVQQVMKGYPPSAYYPQQYPQGYIPATTTTTSAFSDNIGLGMVGAAAGGGAAGFFAAKAIGAAKGAKNVAASGTEAAGVASTVAKGGFVSSLKALGGAALKGTGIGAAVGGVFSLVGGLIRGERGKDLAGSVVADTAGGAASGLAATVTGGLAAAALAAFGVGGIGLTLIGAGVGIAGGMAADYLFRNSGARDSIKDMISN